MKHTREKLPAPYEKGRRCHCGAIISIYVPGTRCRIHRAPPPLRDMSRVTERDQAGALLAEILDAR